MTWTLLHDACQHLDGTRILGRCKSNPREPLEADDHGSTPLHLLALLPAEDGENTELMQALISCCPAAVSSKDVHGNTVLHLAASNSSADASLLKVLVDACPTLPSITNKEGCMPLHFVCRFNPQNERVIGCLIEAYPHALRSRIKVKILLLEVSIV
jgi:ankyrin repeat protein